MNPETETNSESVNAKVSQTEFVCAVHGPVGPHYVTSSIPGHRTNLCLICVLEKLKEIGVCELTTVQS